MTARALVRPIQTLREHVTALEAAITLTLADTGTEPVHRLRTSTRRIEAQLELLSLLPALPDPAGPIRKVRKLLKRLRRAAGAVRDLDVQRKLVRDQQAKVTAQPPSRASKELHKESRDLRRTLKNLRGPASKHLLKVLKEEQQKLTPALEHLLRSLRPAEDLSLSRTHLSQLTSDWYLHHAGGIPSDQPDRLHTIRKFAKLARYIAEAGDAKLADTFESLQESGGAWHDLATLACIAEEQLGPDSALARSFAQSRDAALEQYQNALLQKPSKLTRQVVTRDGKQRLQGNDIHKTST